MVKKLMSFFIPQREFADEETLRKANLTIGTLLIVLYFTLNYVLISYFIEYPKGIESQLFLFVVAIISLILYKYGINKTFIHFLFFISATISILITVYYSGGFESFILPWLASTPIVALLVWGKRGSLISLFFVIFVTVWLFLIYDAGITLPTLINKEAYRKPFYLSCAIGLILILYFIAFVFENAKNNAMNQLKIAQNQLVLKEKLASLGELTSGIAHELQNPLNFVNNFSQLNEELIEELKEIRENLINKVKNKEDELIDELLTSLAQNQKKINFHGSRASNIIKKMLEHSGLGNTEKKKSNINFLVKDVLLNSFAIFKSKYPSSLLEFQVDLDSEIKEIEIGEEDLRWVFSNIYSNAFFALIDKAKSQENFKSIIKVSSKNMGNSVEIRVFDNGTGIADGIGKKIFQPFFTTRTTGEGTGLGMSISYDIITKGHNGEITFQSKLGEFTEFIVRIPT